MDNPKPKILPVSPGRPSRVAIDEAVHALGEGALIILPTETVYGIAGDPRVEGCEDRLYAAKERDRGKPIPLLASGLRDVERAGAVLSFHARRLARRYWPGPLTLVLPCAGRSEGFRVPDQRVALEVLKAAGSVLRVTSANLSGEPAAKTVEAAVAALGSRVALALDAGPASLGIESTVVDATGPSLKILRHGFLSKEAIMSPPRVVFVCTGNTCRSPMAEALLQKWLGDNAEWEVGSAGVSALGGEHASHGSMAVMAEKDIDLAGHRSRPLTQPRVDDADLIVVMTEAHKDAVLQRFPGVMDRVVLLNMFNPSRRGEDVPDPFGMKLDVYRAIRDEINAAMPDLVLHLHGLSKGRCG